MPLQKNLNVNPYYDDFDENKNFYRVLHKPGYPIQARELNQAQNILQTQIEKFSSRIMKDGDNVVPGEFAATIPAAYVRCSAITQGSRAKEYIGYTLTGVTSGVKAVVNHAEEATDDDDATFYITYISSGTTSESTTFQEGETLESDTPDAYTAVVGVNTISRPINTSPTGFGSLFNVTEGYYYVNGFMVRNDAQLITLDKYGVTPTYEIGFIVDEDFVTSEEDSSLLDNSQGSSNFAAPGADRLRITLTLTKREIGSTNPNFITLITVINGQLQGSPDKTVKWDWLYDILARRTFNESGDYIVSEFPAKTVEYYNSVLIQNEDGSFDIDSTINGVFDADPLTGKYPAVPGSGKEDPLTFEQAESNYVVDVAPGLAYVQGYEVGFKNPVKVYGKKSREVQFRSNAIVPVTEGTSISLTNSSGSPDFQNISGDGDAVAFDDVILYRNFIDGYVGEGVDVNGRPLNTGNAPWVTYHIICDNEIGQVPSNQYVTVYNEGNSAVLQSSADIQRGDTIGNARVLISNKIQAFPSGIVKPRYYYPRQQVETLTNYYGYNTTYNLGVLNATFFSQIPVIPLTAGDWVVGEFVTGESSAAIGLVEESTTEEVLILSNVKGSFTPGETVFQGNKSARLYNSGEVSRFQFLDKGTNNNTFDLSGELDVVVRAIGSEITLSSPGDITSGVTSIELTEQGRQKLLNFPYPQGSVANSRINYEVETVQSGVKGYAVIPSNVIGNSITTTKSAYSSLADTNDFSADISVQSRADSEILNIADASLFSGNSGENFISCDNFSGDPSDQLVAGDVVTFVDDTGKSINKLVLFVTRPVGYGSLRSKSVIYFTTTLSSAVTGKTVQRIRVRNTGNADQNLIYQLPQKVVSSIETDPLTTRIDYEIFREFIVKTAGGATEITITTTRTNEQFIDDLRETSLFLAENLSDPTDPNGLEGRSLNPLNTIVEDGGRKITYTFTDPIPVSAKVKIVAPVFVSDAKAKKKRFRSGVDFTILDSAIYGASVISLERVDVLRVREIRMRDSLGGFLDVTDNYNLDDGQRDNYYDISRLILKTGRPVATGDLYMKVDFFEHDDSEGDFFSVDSYTHENGVGYGQIPVYVSSATPSNDKNSPEGTLFLRDCIDFRPTVDAINSNIPTIVDGADTKGAKVFKDSSNGGNGNVPRLPIPGTNFKCDISYYLPKVDSLFLENTGALKLVEGVPGEIPNIPADISTGIRLYNFFVPPYTFSVEDIKTQKFNYKRFRMKDIASIEKKVERLEDIVTLSLLEQSALNMNVRDAVTGLDRFKNGIVVDNFSNHSKGEVGSPEYRNSIDPKQGHLRSAHFTDQVELETIDQTSEERLANLHVKNSALITLPYEDVEFASNPFATRFINLQPFTVFTFDGNLTLTPSVDTWQDINTLPRLVIEDNSVFDAMVNLTGELAASGIGTVWGDWETTGTRTTSTTRRLPATQDTWRQLRDQGISLGANLSVLTGTTDPATNPNMAIRVNDFTTFTDQVRQQSRTVINVGTSNIRETSYGERVVDIELARTMRTVPVQIQAYRLKPNTRYYAFFDGIDVSEWVSIDNTTNDFPDGLSRYSGAPNSNPKGFGFPLVSDDVGTLTGLFLVPNGRKPSSGQVFRNLESVQYETSGPSRQFNTGTRTFRLTSSPTNNTDLNILEAFAEATFSASGVLVDKQETVVSTREPSFSSTTSIVGSQTRTLEETRTGANLVDPVAQTFLVDNNSPDGIFLTELEVYFRSKDATQGVEAYLVSTDGQVPTDQIIPFSKVQKSSDSVIRVYCDNNLAVAAGTTFIGSISGARGVVKNDLTFDPNKTNNVVLSNYLNEFVPGEEIVPELTPATNVSFRIVEDSYQVSRVDVRDLGSGYTTATVQFSDPDILDGVAATGEAVIKSGRVVEVTVTNPGSGYTSIPSVSINGDGTGAIADVRVVEGTKAVEMGVATSEDATAPTIFKFPAPVYLLGNTNYAFVLKAPTSLDYTVYTAKMGENLLGTDTRVTKQAALGSIFKSQNGGLWTEDQTQDIKFILRRASFQTNSNATVRLQNAPLAKRTLATSPIETNSSGTNVGSGVFGDDPTVIRVYHYMHGLLKGDLVYIDGVNADVGGIPVDEINNLHTVLESDINTFTVAVTTSATESTKAGGGSVTCTFNRPYEVINVYTGLMSFGTTNVVATNRATECAGISGYNTDAKYRLDTPVELRLMDSYYYSGAKQVASMVNEAEFNGSIYLQGRKSLETTIVMNTLSDKVSPVIDIDRTNAVLVRNLIDSPESGSGIYGNNFSRITLDSDLPLAPLEKETRLKFFSSVSNIKTVQVRDYNAARRSITVSGPAVKEITEATNIFMESPLPDAVLTAGVISFNQSSFVVDNFTIPVGAYLKVDDEIVKITNTAGTNTLSVLRGQLGTSPATHDIGSNLYIVTAAGPFFDGTPNIAKVTSTFSDYFVPETNIDGSVYSKWISRKFNFENVCDGIEIKLSAVFYEAESIRVYYRAFSAAVEGESPTGNWIPFNGNGLANGADQIKPYSSEVVDPILLDENSWRSLTFSVQDIPRFTGIQVKIVMTSENPAKAPLIDDFRMVCSE